MNFLLYKLYNYRNYGKDKKKSQISFSLKFEISGLFFSKIYFRNW